MTTASTAKPHRETLRLQLSATERKLIDSAAEPAGKTRADFILEVARRAAEETLLDRALTVVNPEAYREFLKRLDRPASPSEQLCQTIQTKAPGRRSEPATLPAHLTCYGRSQGPQGRRRTGTRLSSVFG